MYMNEEVQKTWQQRLESDAIPPIQHPPSPVLGNTFNELIFDHGDSVTFGGPFSEKGLDLL